MDSTGKDTVGASSSLHLLPAGEATVWEQPSFLFYDCCFLSNSLLSIYHVPDVMF